MAPPLSFLFIGPVLPLIGGSLAESIIVFSAGVVFLGFFVMLWKWDEKWNATWAEADRAAAARAEARAKKEKRGAAEAEGAGSSNSVER